MAPTGKLAKSANGAAKPAAKPAKSAATGATDATSSDAAINAQYQHLTPEEHLSQASMWTGSRDVVEYDMILAHDTPTFGMARRTFPCTPCSEKCLDEPLVNAYDETLRRLQVGARMRAKPTADLTAATHSLVTVIDVQFGPRFSGPDVLTPQSKPAGGKTKCTVWFSVRNDGPGMPVIERDLHDGTRVWLPEMLMGRALTGSNFQKDSATAGLNVTGGCNGVGAKIANIYSWEFYVYVYDARSGRTYTQWFRDHMQTREEPTIGTGTGKHGFTEIGFRLDLEKTGWSADLIKSGAAFDSLRAFALTRATHIAAALGQYGVTVRFNGAAIPVRSPEDMAKLLGAGRVLSLGDRFPWKVAIGEATETLSGSLSVLNGLAVAGGSHVNELLKQLAAAVKAKLGERRFGPTQLAPLVFVQVVGYVQNAQWDGQRKDRLTISDDKLRPYKLPLDALRDLIQTLADGILLQEAQKEPPKKSEKALVKEARGKYKGAKCAGGRESENCVLFAAEGDSAINTVDKGINAEWKRRQKLDPKLRGSAFDYNGIFSLGGVIINARKESRAKGRAVTVDDNDDSDVELGDELDDASMEASNALIRSEKLRNNAVVQRLVQVLGLQYGAPYDESEAGNAAFRNLKYGRFIIITDQDYDGHNIAGLVLNFFHRFWPALIKRGYVTRLVTPVIRALPKRGKDVYQFYSEAEFTAWVAEDPKRKLAFEAMFFKGLGGWNGEQCGGLFEDFLTRSLRFRLDKQALRSFETFYGDDTTLRKEVLRTTPLQLTAEQERHIKESHEISCTTLLRRDVQAYQLDNLNRKLPGVMDGLYESTRKAVHGLRALYARNGKLRKIADLATAVMAKSLYHHGNASMEGVLTRMGQRHPGGRLYPLLITQGQFGSRSGGKPSSARYISAKLNVALADMVFPRADDHLLRYVTVDGEVAEPVTYVPTIPLAIMEGLQLPATGWTIQKWPVRLEDVVFNVRSLLGDTKSAIRAFKMELRQFPTVAHLQVKNKRAEAELLVGQFVREGPLKIRITELPPTVTTLAFMKRLDKLDEVSQSSDVSDTDAETINIEVVFNKGVDLDALETAHKRDGFKTVPGLAWYLGLVLTVHHQLNFMGVDGTVRSFGTYEELFHEWFAARRELYARRLDRQTVLYEIELIILRAQLRYAQMLAKMKLERRPKSEMEAELDTKKFPRVHLAAFNRCGGIATEDLRRVILEVGYGGVDTDSTDDDDTAEQEFSIPKGVPCFDYLLRRSMLELTKESETKIEAHIATIEAALAEIRADTVPFRGAKVWRKEFDAAIALIRDGIARNWANKEEMSYRVNTV